MEPLLSIRGITVPAILSVKIKANFTKKGLVDVDVIHDELENYPLHVFTMK